MIQTDTNTGTVEGNMPIYRKNPMKVSKAAEKSLTHILSTLYNEPLTAVLREYYANAVDSHRSAGTTRPVEITLPTTLTPTFWVRDWGTGMSEDFIVDIYTSYGESTKKDSAEDLGHFGMGSKSGFAICSQFTVISYYNGKKYSILFRKSADGSFDGDIVSCQDTDEANGVLVSIPIREADIEPFNRAAHELFSYVDPETVLVDGDQPSHNIFKSGYLTKLNVDVDSGIEVWTSKGHSYHSTAKFIMGGIPYNISPEQFRDSMAREGSARTILVKDIYFVVPLGAVTIGVIREGVQSTKTTEEVLDKAMNLLVEGLKITIQDTIDKCSDYKQVMNLVTEGKRIIALKDGSFTYKGQPVYESIKTEKDYTYLYRAVGVSVSSDVRDALSFRVPYVVLTGVSDHTEFEKKHGAKLLPYLRATVQNSITLVVTNSVTDLIDPKFSHMLEDNSLVSFLTLDELLLTVKEYKALAKERAAKTPKTPKKDKVYVVPVLDIQSSTVTWTDITELDSSECVYLSSSSMHEPAHYQTNTFRQRLTSFMFVDPQWIGRPIDDHSSRAMAQTLRGVTDKKVVLLSGSRTVSFLKKHLPDAVSLTSVIDSALVEFDKTVKAEDIKKSETSEHPFVKRIRSILNSEQVARIEDKELREALQASSGEIKGLGTFLQSIGNINFYNYNRYTLNSRFKISDSGLNGTDFGPKYPLISSVYTYIGEDGKNHMVDYINMVHRSLTKNEKTATLEMTKG